MRILILMLICLSMTGCQTFFAGMKGLGDGMVMGAQQTKQSVICTGQNLGAGVYQAYCN